MPGRFRLGVDRVCMGEQGVGKGLLEYPCWSSDFWRPFAVFPEEGVCEDGELSHDGGDCELGRLSGCYEGLIFFLLIFLTPFLMIIL